MVFDFRKVAAGVAVFGLALGVAFGAGIAVGRGDPKTIESGLSAQQLQTLLGTDVLQSAAANAAGDGGDTAEPGAAPGAAPGSAVVSAEQEVCWARIQVESLQR